MAIRFQLRRGNTAENDAFTGALGELTLDTQRKVIRFHDGVTRGGIELGAPSLVAVQRPTADNNYTWFRKYSDGWVEQGGLAPQPSTATVGTTVTLPIAMSDSNYFCVFQNYNTSTGNNSSAYVADNCVSNYTSTSFTFARAYQGPKRWFVMGYAAA